MNIEAGAGVGFGLYDAEPMFGAGANVKFLWPLKQHDKSITAGVDFGLLNYFDSFTEGDIAYSYFLASIGYRKNFKSFYIEPQIGLGINNEEGYNSACAFAGIEPGLQKKRFSFAINYRFISTDGFTYDWTLHTLSFKIGYRIFKNKK